MKLSAKPIPAGRFKDPVVHLNSSTTLPASPASSSDEDMPELIEVENGPRTNESLTQESPKASEVPEKWRLEEGKDFIKAGWWGKGEPICTRKSSTKVGRHLQDGGGLCSPGRWTQRNRILPKNGEFLRKHLDDWIQTRAGKEGEGYLEKIVYGAMAGKFEEDPFAGEVTELRNELCKLLAKAGHTRPKGAWRTGQVIDYGLIYMLGQFLDDPDYECMADYAQGVRVGVDVQLPRTAKVWPAKTKWPLEPYEVVQATELNENYSSAKIYREELNAELANQVERGWMIPMTLKQAQEQFGPVSIAPMAVIMEQSGQSRTLHDATNGAIASRFRMRNNAHLH